MSNDKIYCEDCINYIYDSSRGEVICFRKIPPPQIDNYPISRHPIIYSRYINLPCKDVRMHENMCGMEGKWFERKSQSGNNPGP